MDLKISVVETTPNAIVLRFELPTKTRTRKKRQPVFRMDPKEDWEAKTDSELFAFVAAMDEEATASGKNLRRVWKANAGIAKKNGVSAAAIARLDQLVEMRANHFGVPAFNQWMQRSTNGAV